MALANVVLVHGPPSLACAVRLPGRISLEVVARPKRVQAPSRCDGPLRSAPAPACWPEALDAWLPRLKNGRCPRARRPFEGPGVCWPAHGRDVRRPLRSRPAPAMPPWLRRSCLHPGQPDPARALAVALAHRGGPPRHHGARALPSIRPYEHGPGAPKEHERCGRTSSGDCLSPPAARRPSSASGRSTERYQVLPRPASREPTGSVAPRRVDGRSFALIDRATLPPLARSSRQAPATSCSIARHRTNPSPSS